MKRELVEVKKGSKTWKKMMASVSPEGVKENPYGPGIVMDWEADPRGDAAIRAAYQGGPQHRALVPFADIVVSNPAILARARRVVREEPHVLEVFRKSRAEGIGWIVYRNDDGELVMFDDYNGYAAAELDKVESIAVRILG